MVYGNIWTDVALSSHFQFNGSYTTVSAPQLGAVAIKSAHEKSKVPVCKITDVYMGNVLQGSVGQAPARQAAIFAGLPSTVEAITINKVCASGLKAVVFAAQVNGKWNAGDQAGAVEAAAKAKKFATIALVLGIIATLIYVVLIFAGVLSSDTSTTGM